MVYYFCSRHNYKLTNSPTPFRLRGTELNCPIRVSSSSSFSLDLPDAMGGGNGQKAKMAREKNLEKQKAAGKGSQLKTNEKAMSIQCKVCMQAFMCTTSEVKCREHAEAKHPKSDVYACFPHLKK
ncbi:unnamed protein product [Malus baccata var. baccata]